ncbi:MAG TPA: sigma-70 family RNA polymerase sigma factor [Candidatus Angelobacter sp.]|nr:sigma-70 family RNA polymerase sigma factor [Candidatus Angelobacter sp.]
MDTPAPVGIMAGHQPHLLNESTGHHNSRNDSAGMTENERLVQGCIQGDQHAWKELTNKYKRLIFSIPMISYGARPEDAADVFQAVCIEVWHSLVQLKNVRSLRAWLITVTLRQSYRWKRKLADHVELDAMEPKTVEEIAAVAPADKLADLEREQVLRKVVAKLSHREQELVRLLFFEQPPMPYADVAKRLGLATGSIGLIRARCLEKLRKTLAASGFY